MTDMSEAPDNVVGAGGDRQYLSAYPVILRTIFSTWDIEGI